MHRCRFCINHPLFHSLSSSSQTSSSSLRLLRTTTQTLRRRRASSASTATPHLGRRILYLPWRASTSELKLGERRSNSRLTHAPHSLFVCSDQHRRRPPCRCGISSTTTRTRCRPRHCLRRPRRPSATRLQRQGPIRRPPQQPRPRSGGEGDAPVRGRVRRRRSLSRLHPARMHTSLGGSRVGEVRVCVIPLCG